MPDWELPYDAGRAAVMLADQDGVMDLVPGRPVQVAIEHDGEVIGNLAVGLDGGGDIATLGYTLARAHQGRGWPARRPARWSTRCSREPECTRPSPPTARWSASS